MPLHIQTMSKSTTIIQNNHKYHHLYYPQSVTCAKRFWRFAEGDTGFPAKTVERPGSNADAANPVLVNTIPIHFLPWWNMALELKLLGTCEWGVNLLISDKSLELRHWLLRKRTRCSAPKGWMLSYQIECCKRSRIIHRNIISKCCQLPSHWKYCCAKDNYPLCLSEDVAWACTTQAYPLNGTRGIITCNCNIVQHYSAYQFLVLCVLLIACEKELLLLVKWHFSSSNHKLRHQHMFPMSANC